MRRPLRDQRLGRSSDPWPRPRRRSRPAMAPTLKGRHKEVTCPECRATCSPSTPRSRPRPRSNSVPDAPRSASAEQVGDLRQLPVQLDRARRRTPSFKGDRILVMKFPYELPFLPGAGGRAGGTWSSSTSPRKPETNYIKRLDRPARRGPFGSTAATSTPARAGTNDPFEIQPQAA